MNFFDEYIISDDYSSALESYNNQLYEIANEAFSKFRETLSNFCFKRSSGCKKRYKICKSKGHDRLANMWGKWSIRLYKLAKFIRGVKSESDMNQANKDVEEAKKETNKLEIETKEKLKSSMGLPEETEDGRNSRSIRTSQQKLREQSRREKDSIRNSGNNPGVIYMPDNSRKLGNRMKNIFMRAKETIKNKKKTRGYTEEDAKRDDEYIKKLSKVKKITEAYIEDYSWDYFSCVCESYIDDNDYSSSSYEYDIATEAFDGLKRTLSSWCINASKWCNNKAKSWKSKHPRISKVLMSLSIKLSKLSKWISSKVKTQNDMDKAQDEVNKAKKNIDDIKKDMDDTSSNSESGDQKVDRQYDTIRDAYNSTSDSPDDQKDLYVHIAFMENQNIDDEIKERFGSECANAIKSMVSKKVNKAKTKSDVRFDDKDKTIIEQILKKYKGANVKSAKIILSQAKKKFDSAMNTMGMEAYDLCFSHFGDIILESFLV